MRCPLPVLFLTVLVCLAGCVRHVPQRACPILVTWSLADQTALKRDLQADNSAVIHRVAHENEGFRTWARKCQSMGQ